MGKLKILFLCTGNSCRSQMAEGWARKLKAGEIEPFSAGVRKSRMDPRAIQVMAEAGVDISGQFSKTVDELPAQDFDYVITLCAHAEENCPVFPGLVRRLHAGFDDPPKLAQDAKDDEQALAHYRRVRDELRDFVAAMPGNLERPVDQD